MEGWCLDVFMEVIEQGGRGLELIWLLYNAEPSDSGNSKPFFSWQSLAGLLSASRCDGRSVKLLCFDVSRRLTRVTRYYCSRESQLRVVRKRSTDEIAGRPHIRRHSVCHFYISAYLRILFYGGDFYCCVWKCAVPAPSQGTANVTIQISSKCDLSVLVP